MLRAFTEIWETAAASRGGSQAIPLYGALSTHYDVKPGWIRFEKKDPKRIDIVRMYEKLQERIVAKRVPSLYREVALSEHDNVFDRRRGEMHLGQMGGKNPLAPSQRDSLLAYLQTPEYHVTAINGPPGTGKTTLLQSVLATELVASALRQGDPPLYLAVAATNQAVSNIIAAFREATDDLDHPLADRWIPGLKRRYGAYFRGSRGEAKRLSRGSIVCIPLQFNSHAKEYKADDIERLRQDVEIKNQVGDEVAVDLFLPLAESPAVVAAFLETAGSALGKSFETLSAFLCDIHETLKNLTDQITEYAKAADIFMEEIERIGALEFGNVRAAREAFSSRVREAEEQYREVAISISLECRAEEDGEAALRKEEDHRLGEFDANEAAIERAIAIAEDERIAAKRSRFDVLKLARESYETLRPPATLFGWLVEALFPWVRNRKQNKLRDLAVFVRSNEKVTLGTSVDSLRAFIETALVELNDLEIVRENIAAEYDKRRRLRDEQRTHVVRKIENMRRSRELERMARDVPRKAHLLEKKNTLDAALYAVQSLDMAHLRLERLDPDFSSNEFPPFETVRGRIDTTFRLKAFLLASHYWEGRFLQDAPKSGWRAQANRRRAFRILAMLTPCFVSTFDKLGTSFNIMKSGETHPLWEFADCLIVDEAGQASPDKGAFAFSFAKKAIVVGDELQLPPVNASDSVTILTSVAASAGFLEDEFAADHGLLAGQVGIQKGPGSIMRMASSSAYFHASEEARGMWLRDHFRCDPRIIRYSNEIWYTGQTSLVPRRPRQEGLPLPHFGHMHVSGKATNRSNRAEALSILHWINAFGKALEDHYGIPLHEIIAVLTPFKNQKTTLQDLRDKTFRWNRVYAMPSGITMGTVHALQGAERPVVLFSTVYDEPNSRYFYDAEHTMLNVAVSRAKDSFIVFGNRTIFVSGQPEISKPSTVLRRHIFDAALRPVPRL